MWRRVVQYERSQRNLPEGRPGRLANVRSSRHEAEAIGETQEIKKTAAGPWLKKAIPQIRSDGERCSSAGGVTARRGTTQQHTSLKAGQPDGRVLLEVPDLCLQRVKRRLHPRPLGNALHEP